MIELIIANQFNYIVITFNLKILNIVLNFSHRNTHIH